MSLRVRIALLTGATVAVLLLLLSVCAGFIVSRSFTGLESRLTVQNVQRVQEAIKSDIDALRLKAVDWASWDATYNFVQHHDPQYVEENLTVDSLISLRLHLFAIIDPTGKVVFAKALDDAFEQVAPVPADFSAYIQPGGALLHHPGVDSTITGILPLQHGPLMFVSLPILTSSGEGPIHGTLIMAQYLDDNRLASLAERTHLDIALQPYADRLPAGFREARAQLSTKQPIWIHPLSSREVAGYAAIRDLKGNPIRILQIKTSRDIHKQGILTLVYIISALAVIGVLLTILVFRLLDYLVIIRLRGLTEVANRIAAGDLDVPIPAVKDDEIGTLAAAFHNIQQTLQTLKHELDRLITAILAGQITARASTERFHGGYREIVTGINATLNPFERIIANVKEATHRSVSMAEQVADAAASMGTASQKVADGAEQVLGGSKMQAGSAGEAAANMQQFQQIIQAVAQGAQEQAASARETATFAQQAVDGMQTITSRSAEALEKTQAAEASAQIGADVVRNAVDGMRRVQSAASLSAERVTDLSALSQRIGAIVEGITAIAQQTNMLALNAAIEAARAGVKGKGFAVVADQVRKLAEHSSEETQKVGALVGQIQVGVAAAVEAMNAGRHEVEHGMTQASQAGEALIGIVATAQQASRQVEAVAEIATTVTKHTEQVLSAIMNVTTVAEATGSSAREMADTSVLVSDAIQNVAAICEESSASASELSQLSTEQLDAVEQMVAASRELTRVADSTKALLQQYRVGEEAMAVAPPVPLGRHVGAKRVRQAG